MSHPYARALYAQSLSHIGQALEVPEWNSSVIMRPFGGMQDAAGTYPIAILPPDADIAGGLNFLRDAGLVSITLVLDDFHRPDLQELEKHFDWFKKFKTHYVYRCAAGVHAYQRHHRYELKQAHKHLRTGLLDWTRDKASWIALYENLTAHRNLKGTHVFPLAHHEFLAQAGGVTAIGAWAEDELVCAHVFVEHQGKVHSHLAASSEQGYHLRAAYAVNDAALQHFKHAELINFGGGAGNADDANDGLAKFKRGFSNETAQSYLCGAILDQARYNVLVKEAGVSLVSSFFPAYRATR